MRRLPQLLCFSLAAVILISALLPAQEGKGVKPADIPAPNFTKEIQPLLKKLCVECHGTKKPKGDLDLAKITGEKEALAWPEVWDLVGQRVRDKEMPPAKSVQPTDQERQALLAWTAGVSQAQVSCDKAPKDQLEKSVAGFTMSRRLNRLEYGNTLRDLLGFDVKLGDLLPSDGGGGEGFDNTGATLFITPAHMEKYLEAAEVALATLFSDKADAKMTRQVEAARRKIVFITPGPLLDAQQAGRQILHSFMDRAFRRPATEAEVKRYFTLFETAFRRGDSFEQALKLAFKGVLVSPHFLFLIEPAPSQPGPYRLGPYEIASKLSYFLWATMPDEPLLRLAREGKLHDDDVLRGESRRMLADPRAKGLAENFAVQWLGLRPLGSIIRPDKKAFPEFDDELAQAMTEETVLFFDRIIREDKSVLEIIDGKFTFVNERLAKLYKMDGVEGKSMRLVELDDPNRGGILGQASILTATSHPNRTSPVLRGKWILETLLGADVPPPPPNVPELPAKDKKGNVLSQREQLELHRPKPGCATCHNRMDPLGFGLENYDPLGRWREELDGKAIDAVGILPSGEKFDGAGELKSLLLEKRRTDFLRNLSRKMLGYGLNRQLGRMDLCVVDACVANLEKGGYRPSQLVETIVLSYPFTHRYQPK